jgi:prepilin-type N-terminal cleavage/methylation domain-containing protein
MKLKAFTLVELVVVMAMVGVLAMSSIVGYDHFVGRAKNVKAEEIISNIKMEVYSLTHLREYSVGFEGSEGYTEVTISYDASKETFTLSKEDTAPTAEETIKALESFFRFILPPSDWVINSAEKTTLNSIQMNLETNEQISFYYVSDFDGNHTWYANIITEVI